MRTILRHRLTVLLLFAPIFPLNKFLALKLAFFPCWKGAEFFFSGPLKLEGNLTELANFLDFEVKFAEIRSVVSWKEVMLLYI